MLISCTAPQASLEPVSRESFRAVVREGGDARLGWNEEEAEEEEEEQEEQEEDEVSTLLGGSESKSESKSNNYVLSIFLVRTKNYETFLRS